MRDLLLLYVIVTVPLALHVGLTTVTYLDARSEGIDARKWGLIAFLVPLFGPTIYLLRRSEQYYDPETDPYRRGTYTVHESRQGEGPHGEGEVSPDEGVTAPMTLADVYREWRAGDDPEPPRSRDGDQGEQRDLREE